MDKMREGLRIKRKLVCGVGVNDADYVVCRCGLLFAPITGFGLESSGGLILISSKKETGLMQNAQCVMIGLYSANSKLGCRPKTGLVKR